MARILGVGIATLDIVHSHASYPPEDAELRARAQHVWRGGNATNSLCVLAGLGHACDWAGTLGEDFAAGLIEQDLRGQGVGLETVKRIPRGASPCSLIYLAEATASRTISHYRDLPELDAGHFRALPLDGYDWLHFEGRAVNETRAMLQDARRRAPRATRSLEIEKPRENIESLFPLAEVLLFSRQYALARGFDQAPRLLRALHHEYPGTLLVCAWGEQGAWLRAPDDGDCRHVPAQPPPRVLDTRGAGDVFNAAFIHARLLGHEPEAAVRQACRMAGEKCGRHGLRVKRLA